ncbi:DUF2182 domain-containing protein [Lutibaculum baratangense]|uniref:Transmembrane protein n=1 Tax=Lutibaculum baratangense AMV1 TaxID=631454 RepID=V4R9B0_9HYPH|nr:DUF2182 domain-containing protein [Lutibaculum baratangense]ESR22786.1 hypothetical protein N177_3923 [Lutibaculum baratangense AMV1]
MAAPSVDWALRHERHVILIAIGGVAALAWAYIVWLALHMDMGGERLGQMSGMMMPDITGWAPLDFAEMWAMWAVMMVGMMLPSVAPMALVYARVEEHARAQGKAFASVGWFLSGYLAAWAGFSVFATLAQWALERAALMSPMSMALAAEAGGVVLVAAGLYQWTPLKEACLAQCQAPLVFIQRHGGFRRTVGGSFQLGFTHGLYCIGCCWALMALLFVAGVMNLLWVAVIAIFVLLEKVVPWGRTLSRLAGAALVAAGAVLLLH